VANDVSAPGAGFEHDTNAVTIFSSGGEVSRVPLADKRRVARAVIDAVVTTRHRRSTDHPEEQP
jgi:phosphopantothenoylcysteine decarboxylase/phosphopantothenate--cysteine ligase